MNLRRYCLLAILPVLIAVVALCALGQVTPDVIFESTFTFTAGELTADGVHVRKCVSVLTHAGKLDSVALNRSAGTGTSVDLWVLSKDVAATTTALGVLLASKPAVAGAQVLQVDRDFISGLTGADATKLCVELQSNGGTSAAVVILRGRTARSQ